MSVHLTRGFSSYGNERALIPRSEGGREIRGTEIGVWKRPRTCGTSRRIFPIFTPFQHQKAIGFLECQAMAFNIGKQVSVMRFLPLDLYERTLELYNLLNVFEYQNEVSTLLELALWNVTMADRIPKNKKATIDDKHSCRNQSRINCGSEIVVPNVLPFLWRRFDGPR